MQLHFSTVLGMPVSDEQDGSVLGTVSSVLVDVDRGTVEGFFVLPEAMLAREQLFLQVQDVLRVGVSIHVRDQERLTDPHDIIRIAPLLHDVRTFIGQRIVTEETKRMLGKCVDFQFDTVTFKIVWFFPRLFFMRRPAIPRSSIVEVTEQAIIVREPAEPIVEKTVQEKPSITVATELSAPPAG